MPEQPGIFELLEIVAGSGFNQSAVAAVQDENHAPNHVREVQPGDDIIEGEKAIGCRGYPMLNLDAIFDQLVDAEQTSCHAAKRKPFLRLTCAHMPDCLDCLYHRP